MPALGQATSGVALAQEKAGLTQHSTEPLGAVLCSTLKKGGPPTGSVCLLAGMLFRVGFSRPPFRLAASNGDLRSTLPRLQLAHPQAGVLLAG